MANCIPPLILRIKENRFTEGRDWPVPMDVNFRMVLVRNVHLMYKQWRTSPNEGGQSGHHHWDR